MHMNEDYCCTMQPRCGVIDEDVVSGDCVHCECCCDCLACIYAPHDSVPLTPEQRAPIAGVQLNP